MTEYRFDEAAVAASGGRFQERWFAGVHGDIGGQNTKDDQLPDIAFAWMVREAIVASTDGEDVGLRVDPSRYRKLVGIDLGAELPPERALGIITPNNAVWRGAVWDGGSGRFVTTTPSMIPSSTGSTTSTASVSATPRKPFRGARVAFSTNDYDGRWSI